MRNGQGTNEVKRRSNRRLILLGMIGFLGVAGVASWRKMHTPPPKVEVPLPIVPQYPDPPGIVIHCSDSPAKVGKVVINAARLEEIHKKKGYGIEFEGKKYHIGYHYVILPDGTIEKGRPDHCEGSHAPTFNYWLGVCLVGQFSSQNRHNWYPTRPTDEQLQAVLTLCQELMSKYHIPPALVKRHGDVTMTNCPGDRFPFQWLTEHLTEYAVTHPETNPTDGRSLVVEQYIPPKVKEIYRKRAERYRKQEEVRRKRRVVKNKN